jgi:hypothetical protein
MARMPLLACLGRLGGPQLFLSLVSGPPNQSGWSWPPHSLRWIASASASDTPPKAIYLVLNIHTLSTRTSAPGCRCSGSSRHCACWA